MAKKQDVYHQLKAEGALSYGATFSHRYLRRLAGIEYPEVGTKEEFDELALRELAIVDYMRGQLIAEGKYLKSVRDHYRILTPSENASQVEAYMKSADGKLKRAIRLSRNTPQMADQPKSNSMARAMMKQESIARQRKSLSVAR